MVALFSAPSILMDAAASALGPDATDVLHGRGHLPQLKLIDQGVVNETLMAIDPQQPAVCDRHRGDTYCGGCHMMSAAASYAR